MRRFYSPLRYPGGKARLSDFVRLIIEKNDLVGGHYIELYAGGAGLAVTLLLQDTVSHIHINDLSHSLFAFWYSVLYETEKLCKLIKDTPVNMKVWYQQKYIQENLDRFSNLELGFSTFFLNRTNRSGIISGGVIGGKEQKGKWKLNVRYNKSNLIFRIEEIAKRKRQITLYRQDASDFINGDLSELDKDALIYLDPPYYSKGKDLYEEDYRHEDHVEIAQLVNSLLDRYWIVSYDHAPEICDLYQNRRSIAYSLSYSAQDRYRGSEIMFFSDRVSVPEVETPIQCIA